MSGIVLVVVLALDNEAAKPKTEIEDDHSVVRAMLERTRLRCIVSLCEFLTNFKNSLPATRQKACGSMLADGRTL